jgi:NACHT domain- and WD repeat-containing protein
MQRRIVAADGSYSPATSPGIASGTHQRDDLLPETRGVGGPILTIVYSAVDASEILGFLLPHNSRSSDHLIFNISDRLELPTHHSRTFRLFVSSTFSDFRVEREALREWVFPRLRRYCESRGFSFQAVDLRWGVSEEAGLDQRTIPICLEEARRCRSYLQPHFLVLLGDRYGWQPLPWAIPEGEYHLIEEYAAEHDPRALKLLREWYLQKDENAVPAEYPLKTRKESDYDHARARDWQDEVEQPLLEVMRAAMEKHGRTDQEAVRQRYYLSATHLEICQGLGAQRREEQVFAFIRKLEGRPSPAGPGAEALIDFPLLDSDTAEERRLKALRGERAQRMLEEVKRTLRDQARTQGYAARTGDVIQADGSGETLPPPAIRRFCVVVLRSLLRAVRREMSRVGSVSEREQHRAFRDDRVAHFVGREKELAAIRLYIGANSAEAAPLAVLGPSGAGKSAVMGKASEEADNRLEIAGIRNGPAPVIYRFIGATPGSTVLRSLLIDLCRALGERYDALPALREGLDVKDLAKEFASRSEQASADRPLVILLDALDQLSAADNAHTLFWLPSALPPHVRMIVSAVESSPAGQALARRSQAADVVNVAPISQERAREFGTDLLQELLADGGRKLNEEQQEEVLSKFAAEENRVPLYLKLAFEEARRWRSWQSVKLPPAEEGVEGLIRKALLPRLEEAHGEKFVEHALGFLAAARYGLSVSELLEVLWAQLPVQEEFGNRSHQQAPAQGMPPIVWSRLHADLEPYLLERDVDAAALYGFFHRQMAEAVEQHYLGEPRIRRERHAQLASYFDRSGLYLDEQKRIPNRRKCVEVPYQLLSAGRTEELERVLTDFTFVEAKVEARVMTDLLGDYERTHEVLQQGGALPPAGWLSWWNFLSENAHFLEQHPHLFFQQALNQPWRSPVAHSAERHLGDRPRPPYLRAKQKPEVESDSPAPRVLRHPAPVTALRLTPDGRHIISASTDGPVCVWKFDTGRLVHTRPDATAAIAVTPDGQYVASQWGRDLVTAWEVETGIDLLWLCCVKLRAIEITPDGRNLLTSGDDRRVRVWSFATGAELGCINSLDVRKGRVRLAEALAITPDGRRVIVDGDCRVSIYEVSMSDDEMQIHRLTRTEMDSIPEVLAPSPDGRTVVSAGARGIIVWELETGRVLRSLREDRSNDVSALAVTPDSQYLVVGGESRAVEVWHIETGRLVQELVGHTDGVTGVAVTPEGREVVSAGKDGTIRIWKLALPEPIGQSHPMVGTRPVTRPTASTGLKLDVTSKLSSAVRDLEEAHTHVLLAGGAYVIAAGEYGVVKWDMRSGEPLEELGLPSSLTGFAVAPDEVHAVFSRGARDEYEAPLAAVWHIPTRRVVRELEGNPLWLDDVVTSPDGQTVAGVGLFDDLIRVWDFESGRQKWAIKGGQEPHDRTRLLISHDNQWLLAKSSPLHLGSAKRLHSTLRVWSLKTGDLLQETELPYAHRDGSFAMTPDGRHILYAAGNTTIRALLLNAVHHSSEPRRIVCFVGESSLPALLGRGGDAVACWRDPGRFDLYRFEIVEP